MIAYESQGILIRYLYRNRSEKYNITKVTFERGTTKI